MTFCKVLATGKKDDKDVTVYENWDKYARTPHYEIVISKDSIAISVEKTARTTWAKKFKEIMNA